MTRRKTVRPGTPHEDLLVPDLPRRAAGLRLPALDDVRRARRDQLAGFHAGVKRFVNPHQYPVGLERRLHELKTELILPAREERDRKRATHPTRSGRAVMEDERA